MTNDEINNIVKKIIEELEKLPLFRYKGDHITRVIQEAPSEISSIEQVSETMIWIKLQSMKAIFSWEL